MRTERLLLIASVGLNLGLAFALYQQRLSYRALGEALALEGSKLRQLKQAHEELLRKPSLASNSAADADQLEIARLRNEVTRLRGDLRTASVATNTTAPRRPLPVAPAAPTAPAPGIRQLAAKVSVQLPLGQTLAMGGWPGERPGERIISFMTPSTDPSSPGAISVQSHLITVPDRLLDRLGLQDLRTAEHSSQGTAALDPARLAALLKHAEGENGVAVLSAPRIITINGQAATISVTQAHPNGTQTGPVISLTPTLDGTGANVRLDVNLDLKLAQP